MSDPSVCVTISNGTMYMIIAGSVAALLAVLGTICNMSCPFLSNSMQNRIHGRNTGLIQLLNEQMSVQREPYNV